MSGRNFKFTIVLLVFLAMNISAQNGFEAGGWAGISNYFGDLNTSSSMRNPGFAAGANIRLLFNERLAYKGSLSFANISGDDKYSSNPFERDRNLNFKSKLYDLTNQFEFNFMPYLHGSKIDYFTPYMFVGFSIFHYNPVTKLDGKTFNLREYGTEGQALGEEYFEFSSALVAGMGIKWDINHVLSINLEASYRFTYTDYLDDVSTSYPNIGELASLRGENGVKLSDRSGIPGFATQGKQRGNSRDRDKISFIGVSLMYYFGQLECPEVNKYNFR